MIARNTSPCLAGLDQLFAQISSVVVEIAAGLIYGSMALTASWSSAIFSSVAVSTLCPSISSTVIR